MHSLYSVVRRRLRQILGLKSLDEPYLVEQLEAAEALSREILYNFDPTIPGTLKVRSGSLRLTPLVSQAVSYALLGLPILYNDVESYGIDLDSSENCAGISSSVSIVELGALYLPRKILRSLVMKSCHSSILDLLIYCDPILRNSIHSLCNLYASKFVLAARTY